MSPLRLATFAFVACGCAQSTQPAAISIPVALPPPPASTASPAARAPEKMGGHEDADFSSDKGLVHLRSDGAGHVAGSYPSGVIVCTSEGARTERLECEWMESGSAGRASFVARTDGGYDGTWGYGASATDGGSWPLSRVGSSASGLDGVYDSNWGQATMRDAGADVHVDYGRGTMECQKRASQLVCTWTEGGSSGQAELAVEANGVMRGHWGNGASSTDGGVWVFVKR